MVVKVIKEFRDKNTGRLNSVGATIGVSNFRGAELSKLGFVELVKDSKAKPDKVEKSKARNEKEKANELPVEVENAKPDKDLAQKQ